MITEIKKWVKSFYRRKSMKEHITPEVRDVFYNEKLDEKIYIYKIWEDKEKGKFVKFLIKETYGLFLEAFLLNDINLKI